MYRIALILVVAAVSISGCTRLITERLPSQDVDDSFRLSTVSWTSGAKVAIGFKAFEHQGRVGLCGAWAESPGGGINQSRFNERMIQTRRAEVDGETLANDLGWFARVSYQEGALPQGMANCRLIDQTWRSWYDREVRLIASRTRFRIID